VGQQKLTAGLTAGLLLAGTGANAALINGFDDASNNTSVFISVVERNASGSVLRNLVIDTGVRTLDVFALQDWSTSAAQETRILNFIASAAATSTVRFNVGGGLNDQSFATDLYGFITSGTATGPGPDSYGQLGTAVTNIDTFIGNTANGTFDAENILAANLPINPGWHNNAWGADVGGALESSNEVLFNVQSAIIGWKTDPTSFEIIRSELGILQGNRATGDISFTAIPLPAAAWLLAPMLGLVAPWVQRRQRA
jgi:hypothetical protein